MVTIKGYCWEIIVGDLGAVQELLLGSYIFCLKISLQRITVGKLLLMHCREITLRIYREKIV
jgi:hypothetical protein